MRGEKIPVDRRAGDQVVPAVTISDAAPIDRERNDRGPKDGAPAGTDEQYVELFEDAPCGYLETTPDGTITRVNRTFERWTGHHREALLGSPFVDLLTSRCCIR